MNHIHRPNNENETTMALGSNDLKNASSGDRRATLNQIHAVISQYMVYWHRLAIDTCLFIGTGTVTLTGIYLSAESSSLWTGLFIGGLIFLLGIIGSRVRELTLDQFTQLQGIIQKIDTKNDVFKKGAFIENDTLYPSSWQTLNSGEKWKDPFSIFTWRVTVLLPLILASFVILHAVCVWWQII